MLMAAISGASRKRVWGTVPVSCARHTALVCDAPAADGPPRLLRRGKPWQPHSAPSLGLGRCGPRLPEAGAPAGGRGDSGFHGPSVALTSFLTPGDRASWAATPAACSRGRLRGDGEAAPHAGPAGPPVSPAACWAWRTRHTALGRAGHVFRPPPRSSMHLKDNLGLCLSF